ncbi:hypothetical protein P2P98_14015 [Microbacterium sp. Kw_RZR3]|uniref:hypothetical protein n=1 Tax=Microbacterium sp. Kw_RZR3 TaxID=3032903 RepID=UPI0023DB1175|nr:hypothetical protein [Microbacterium sp. Kw_RZR3]MDF2047278.1 hypothetical protein [Microbacterium sp. Kw_RZR3]
MDAKAAPDLQPKKNNVGLWAACGGCILVPILVIALSFAFSSGKENKPYDPNNASEAIAQCEDLVTSQLKAPSTASFDSAAARNGTAEWTVTGTVDAQNGFGAQIRSTYQCSMRIKGGKIERRLDYFG